MRRRSREDAERQPASEQCLVVLNVNFLNNADIDGKALPPSGAPNVMMAAGGTQLDKIFEANTIDSWQFHVDWKDPSKTKLTGPQKIAVAPYQLPVRRTADQLRAAAGHGPRLDAQGDKIMSRLVYRRIGNRESIVAVHSVNTAAGGGGVRWYEFRIDKARKVSAAAAGHLRARRFFRWMASPAIDRFGNIGIGYSFGGTPHFAGQRFAGAQRRRIHRACSDCARRSSSKARRRRPTRCGGRTTRRPRWIRPTTAPSGTSGTT